MCAEVVEEETGETMRVNQEFLKVNEEFLKVIQLARTARRELKGVQVRAYEVRGSNVAFRWCEII